MKQSMPYLQVRLYMYQVSRDYMLVPGIQLTPSSSDPSHISTRSVSAIETSSPKISSWTRALEF
jgi:hypothetical protein